MNENPKATRRTFFITVGLVASCLIGFLVGRSSDSVSSRVGVNSSEGTSSGLANSDRRRPLIGISSLTDGNYVRAVRDSGGIPVVLPNADGNTDQIEEYIERLDGLLMPGGADIPPSEYNESPHESVNELDQDRFQFERDLCRVWIEETDKPLLGICLGSQWINVASGGSLVQDIPSEYGVNHRGVTHSVDLTEQTRLRTILGVKQLEVNSFHHQAVKTLGQNLRVAACSPDGVIEATESTDPNRFLIGVQWHPERLMSDDKQQARLLEAFIDAAKERSQAEPSVQTVPN